MNVTANSFTLGDKFHEKLEELLQKKHSISLDLLQELEALKKQTIISFKTVRKLQKLLQQNGYPVYLHELLEDSMLYLPKVEPPPRNPQLVARLEKIKAKLANEEYRRITRNVNPHESNNVGTLADFGREGQQNLFFGQEICQTKKKNPRQSCSVCQSSRGYCVQFLGNGGCSLCLCLYW
ncbi:transmembrane protein 199 isoform X2 [Tachysurus fulvidraco]|uniref:transmembrane protein 199 isoform X2 n=1 Tax=Tachysurus fulvidraco TaxID=1234273 RepID=UPI000F513D52|nr:transmembrane protein 199 isoform X2 [Tachysurus fulvidraco]